MGPCRLQWSRYATDIMIFDKNQIMPRSLILENQSKVKEDGLQDQFIYINECQILYFGLQYLKKM